MGRGVFRRIIKPEFTKKDTSEAMSYRGFQKSPTKGAVDAENGTATTNAGSSIGTSGNMRMPMAQTDATKEKVNIPEREDPCSLKNSQAPQSIPDQQDVNSIRGDSLERQAFGRTPFDHQDKKNTPEIYGDVEVCRLLKIRRRKIAEARTKATRGVDWDCVGLHAGMTKKWIEETAIKQGIVPDFFNTPIHPIQENDGVVSCKLIGTWPNRKKVTIEVVATGEAKVATVRDAAEFHLYDIFDARDFGREIAWAAELNNAVY